MQQPEIHLVAGLDSYADLCSGRRMPNTTLASTLNLIILDNPGAHSLNTTRNFISSVCATKIVEFSCEPLQKESTPYVPLGTCSVTFLRESYLWCGTPSFTIWRPISSLVIQNIAYTCCMLKLGLLLINGAPEAFWTLRIYAFLCNEGQIENKEFLCAWDLGLERVVERLWSTKYTTKRGRFGASPYLLAPTSYICFISVE